MEKNNIIEIYQLWESDNKDIRIILKDSPDIPINVNLDDLVRGVVISYEEGLSENGIKYVAYHDEYMDDFWENLLNNKKVGNDYYLLMGDFAPFTGDLNNIELIDEYLENEVNKKNFSNDSFSINKEEIDQLEKRVWPVLIKKACVNDIDNDVSNIAFIEMKGYLYIGDK